LLFFYRKALQSAETGNYDIYVLFIEKGISLIKPNGNLNYILPHKFIIADFGKGIREILHKNKLIEQIISFGHEMIFEDASTYTCLLSLSNKLNTDIQYVEITPNLLNNDKQFYQYEYANIPSGSPWVFTNSESASLIEKLESMPYKLETVLDKVFSGIQTSADNIYSIIGYEKEGFIYGSSKSGIENIKIEKGLLKPLIKGDNIKRYAKMESDVFVIFPYILENGEAIPMSESFIKSNFKEGYNYLKQFENELRNRESGKMNIDDKWFLYNYPKNLYLSNQKKLVSPDITFPMNITTENGSFCLKNGAYGITLKKDFEHHEKMILALLNSKLLWHFLQNTGNVLRGGYFRFNTKYIMPFPIPDILKIESRQIETLVEEILAIKKATPSVSTAEKEGEIDRLVYGLYGLTAEEIGIVENSIK
jgi:TaqI-like C-terminal specificity domain/Eco57I restriction-modification methylase